ncbi:Aste57867_24027 [Aphanomyces stellatus]|uniref:Aste57867_24027 protein n=1 Tax=Aphanomyces stellatus TaxID=120398 RepID=A0A485LP66_9STRA|nr:hypothetical protein As57867_023954 [Aphanomyces stellatus]VFU00670.1 Aste57867_24027 [Aphanomyces stellatus]
MSDKSAAPNNKRKAQWTPPSSHKKRQMASTAKGFSAVLVTCDKTKERQVVKDILNILNDTADILYPKKVDENADDDNDDAAKDDDAKPKSSAEMLQEEIAGLKKDAKAGKTGRFTALDSGVKGIILVQFLDESMDVKKVIDHIFQQVQNTMEFSSRFIQRMIPLEKMCYPSVEDITACATPFIERHFKDTKDIQYSVEVRKRNSGNIASMDIINACVAVVGAQHKVNLTKPEVVIVIEIFKNVCGVSVVTNFHQHKKFNVRMILEPPPKDTEKKDAKKKEDDDKEADE